MLDFVLATKPQRVPNGKSIAANATSNNNYFFADVVSGTPTRQAIQGGEYIYDLVRLDKYNNTAGYLPYDEVSSSEPMVLSKLKIPWRMYRTSFNWSDEQVELQKGANEIIPLLRNWRAAAEQSTYEFFDDAIVAAPDAEAESKETFEGKPLNSIFTYITHDGLVPSEYTTAGVTTIMGQSPATKTVHRNKFLTYDANQYENTIATAMLRAKMALHWEMPTPQSWFENSSLNKMRIYTDTSGVVAYLEYLNNKGNRYDTGNDPAKNIGADAPKFWNIPIIQRDGFDRKAWTKPEYLWIDWNWLSFTFHSKNFLSEKDPVSPTNMTGVHRLDQLTWGNLFCHERRRHLVLFAA